jgi:hypothetical protein
MKPITPNLLPEEVGGGIPTDFDMVAIAKRLGLPIRVEQVKSAFQGYQYRHWYPEEFVQAFTEDPYSVFRMPVVNPRQGEIPLHMWPEYATTEQYYSLTGEAMDRHYAKNLHSIHKVFRMPTGTYWRTAGKRNKPTAYHKLIMHLVRGDWCTPDEIRFIYLAREEEGYTVKDLLDIAQNKTPLVAAYSHWKLWDSL